MRNPLLAVTFILACIVSQTAYANPTLLKTHCAKCHDEVEPEGDFRLSMLGELPTDDSVDFWLDCLDYLKTEDMPPPKKSKLSTKDRTRLVAFFDQQIRSYYELATKPQRAPPRRLNNRELANSVRDVLLLEDVGTHQPTANLLGDTLHDGFDTHGQTLGLSQFHLEQYIDAFRKIVDATLLSTDRPTTHHYNVPAEHLQMTSLSQRKREGRTNRTANSIDFIDPRLRIYFSNFETVPTTGRYKIKIRATGVDRGIYPPTATGIYDNDPIQIKIHLGDRTRVIDLPDNDVMEIDLDEWIAAGTKLELSYPTDGLRLRSNGNFKFQFAIAHDYIQKHDPKRYAAVLKRELPKSPERTGKNPGHWSHWTDEWQGPRPRIFNAQIQGPLYDTWPPKRQVALLGQNPKAANAAAILRPIAERAWRRPIQKGELDSIVHLVKSKAQTLSDIEALKEGIVAILASPSFLFINPEAGDTADRFATKLSYFLKSTTPNARLQNKARTGQLQSFRAIRTEIQRQFDHSENNAFLTEFPQAWLQLDRINFMAPDPDRYPQYDRKRISEDMVAEALHFFRHMIDHNLPLPQMLSANYSFINADLAQIYDVTNAPQDSTLRKHTFTDGRRGGLLGMGAFLTLTADSLTTSPIHRAVYVMQNFLGIEPAPPPANVKIEEPDVRQAKTIKQVLAAHMADETCASCHKKIDPYGYAFENFDPIGAWRDNYTQQIARKPSKAALLEILKHDEQRATQGLPPLPKPWENKPLPVDAAAQFNNGTTYQNIVDYRKQLLTDNNRDLFVRCFISKLLTYANGAEPDNYPELEKILAKSAQNDYRIIDTISAVIDSPLFRGE